MRKFFLIVMMFLLPHQYTWAMVANYDVHDIDQHGVQNTQPHFGHHEHQANLSDVKASTINVSNDKESQATGNQTPSNQPSGNHAHCGFCLLSCGEVLSYSLPVFEATSVQFLSQYSWIYYAPVSNVLDRPKWLQLI